LVEKGATGGKQIGGAQAACVAAICSA